MDRSRAEESLASSFTRVMNATPARWGVLSDVAFSAASASVVLAVGLAIAARSPNGSDVISVCLAVAAIPIVITTVASIIQLRSRGRVIDWLVTLPFPVENVNGLLAGVVDTIEVYFEKLPPGASLPTREEIQPRLDAISDDAFLLGDLPEERLIEIKIGVPDSKRNPLWANHKRWVRVLEIVSTVLVPLHSRLPIERVRVQ
jgi:hypothetical protein